MLRSAFDCRTMCSPTLRFFARNVNFLTQSKTYIDGSWVESSSKEKFEVRNPADGKVIGSIPRVTEADVQRAINAAKNAFKGCEWASMTAKGRSTLLKEWYRVLQCHIEELAALVTAESGKPLAEARGELAYGNSYVEWFAEEARRIYGEVTPSPFADREIITLRQPLGVVALISPWNFPMALIARKMAAALAAGCTVVIKPSEYTPLTTLAIVKLAEEIGFPKGVINVVTTDKPAPIGALLCKSTDIAGLSFTGSTQVGKLLYRECGETVKRLGLELGGNAPFIVFESANLEKAVTSAMVSKFRNCGQTCVSANRFFVQEGVHDDFMQLLKKHVSSLKIGNGSCDGVQIGPLINQMQMDKVSAFVEEAREKNAKVILGGKPLPDLGKLFYDPTIITDVDTSTSLYNDEVFGPVVTVLKFKSEEEVIEKANATRRGLAGYFFSEDIAQVFRVAKSLEVGMVGANEGAISTAEAPFGGVKESGVGREGSRHGIDEYTNIKYVCLGNLKY